MVWWCNGLFDHFGFALKFSKGLVAPLSVVLDQNIFLIICFPMKTMCRRWIWGLPPCLWQFFRGAKWGNLFLFGNLFGTLLPSQIWINDVKWPKRKPWSPNLNDLWKFLMKNFCLPNWGCRLCHHLVHHFANLVFVLDVHKWCWGKNEVNLALTPISVESPVQQ